MKRSKTIKGVDGSRVEIMPDRDNGIVSVDAWAGWLAGAQLTPAAADKAADALKEAAQIVRKAKKK